MTETSFIAKKTPKGYSLRANGVYFGSLYLDREGKVNGGSFRDEEVKAAFRRYCMNPNNEVKTLRQYLTACRKAYEAVERDRAEDAFYQNPNPVISDRTHVHS
jgi:hypothetical protein